MSKSNKRNKRNKNVSQSEEKNKLLNSSPKPDSISTTTNRATNTNESKKKSLLHSFWNIITGVFKIASIPLALGVLYNYFSEIDVSVTNELRLEDPLAAPFIIKNQSFLNIYDVKVDFSPNYIYYDKPKITIIGPGSAYETTLKIDVINPTERGSFFIPKMLDFNAPATKADISVNIHFRPAFFFWLKEKNFRFVTYKGDDGFWYWLPQPLVDPTLEKVVD